MIFQNAKVIYIILKIIIQSIRERDIENDPSYQRNWPRKNIIDIILGNHYAKTDNKNKLLR